MSINKFKANYKVDDEYYTPPNAVKLITPYLTQFDTVWCPFDTSQSHFVKCFKLGGVHKVINTHISTGGDFFKIDYSNQCDCIVSNPPYSNKAAIIKRLCEMGKPFAMLLNASGVFDNKNMFGLAKQYDLEIMYIYPRINFIKDGELKRGTMFQSCYLCRGVLPNKLMFADYDRASETT